MAYTKQNFEDNNILYAQQLNHIEDGIANINTVTNFTSTINEDGDTVLTLTFADGSSKSATISNPVNFKIVGGTTAPESPTENTLWVNTSTAIPSWAFSATEPGSPVAGMVWISTGTSSTVAFNALRKNDVHVYPTGAKQYIGSEWVSKEAKTYQGGEWKHLRTYLYTNGDECEPISGGWSIGNIIPAGYNSYGAATLTKNETSMLFSGTMNNIWTGNEINLSGVSALRLIGTQPTARYVEFFVADKKANGYARKVYGSNDRTNPTANVDVTIDVSDVESGWIAIAIFETQTNLTITEIEVIY